MSGYWLSLHDSVDESWWRPLERLAAQVKDRTDLPPVDPDDYVYCARVPQGDNLPVLHVYRNVLTQRYLNIDEMALTWRYVGKGYALCEIEEAFRRADLQRAELLAGRTRRGFRRPSPIAVPADAHTADAHPADAHAPYGYAANSYAAASTAAAAPPEATGWPSSSGVGSPASIGTPSATFGPDDPDDELDGGYDGDTDEDIDEPAETDPELDADAEQEAVGV